MWWGLSRHTVFFIYGLGGAIIGYTLKRSLIPCILSRYNLNRYAKHWHYPLFEGFSILCSLLVALTDEVFSSISLAILILTLSLLMLAFIDAEHLILPDSIIKPLWGLGFLVNSQTTGLIHLYESAWSSFLAYVGFRLFAEAYYQLTKKTGLGRGDIKLLSVFGAWFGFMGIFVILWVASLSGLAWAMIGLFFKKQAYNTPIPFGPFLVYGAFFYLFVPQAFSTMLP